jgi:hypothetical protein
MFRNLGGKSFWNHLSLESEELNCFQGFPTSPVHILKPETIERNCTAERRL